MSKRKLQEKLLRLYIYKKDQGEYHLRAVVQTEQFKNDFTENKVEVRCKTPSYFPLAQKTILKQHTQPSKAFPPH